MCKKRPKVILIIQSLNELVEKIVSHYNVVGIIESAPKGYKTNSFKNRIREKYLSLRNKSLKYFCKKKNIPYFLMTKNDKVLENWIRELKPDIMITFSICHLLKKEIFSIPKYGTINLHPSYLPEYRGPNPWFWPFYNMDKEFGVSLNFIDEGEDTGDIIYQEKYEIPRGLKFETFYDLSINGIGLKLIFKALENFDNLPKIPQPKNSPTMRARNLSSKEFKSIIDWQNWDVLKVWHILRGSTPWIHLILEPPKGIFSAEEWIVNDFEYCNTSNYKISKIYKENNKYFVVCKNGKIYLEKNTSILNPIRNIVRKIL